MAGIGGTVGSNRADAIYRLAFLVILALGGAVVLGIIWGLALVAGTLWFIVDVAIQLIWNREGWSPGQGGAAMWLERFFYWPIDMLEWLTFGKERFPWLP